MTHLQIAIEGLKRLEEISDSVNERKLLRAIRSSVEESYRVYEFDLYTEEKEGHEKFMENERSEEQETEDAQVDRLAHEDFYLEQTALSNYWN